MAVIPFHTSAGTVDLANLGAEDVGAHVIADALAKTNRYGGRTPMPWSVASHSVLVERLCAPIDLKGWALLHDAHEAFLGDITTPALELICQCGTRSSIEHAVRNAKGKLDRVIGAAWECAPRALSVEIRRADWIALQAECSFFFGVKSEATEARDLHDVEDAFEMIRHMPHGSRWADARDLWISRAEELASMGLLTLPSTRGQCAA